MMLLLTYLSRSKHVYKWKTGEQSFKIESKCDFHNGRIAYMLKL